MVRHDHVREGAHHELGVIFHVTAGLKIVYLFFERFGVEHHPVAYDAMGPLTQDARRHKVENDLFAAHHYGVAGIRPALIPDDHVGKFAQYINDLSLALVAPLKAHSRNIRHESIPPSERTPLKGGAAL